MSEDETDEREKRVAFYAAAVEAWFTTRMEKDRTLVTISAAGIALLAALATSAISVSRCQLWLYGGAATCFVVAIVCGLCVFAQNARHLEHVIDTGCREDDNALVLLDILLLVSFFCGVVLTAAVAFTSALAKLNGRI